ncbi:MAG: hypothetical protein NVS1B11_37760 [Terriglobales bacterium]
MTEYVVKEVSKSLWMVFADRRSVGVCVDENEALKLMAEHDALKNALSAKSNGAPLRSRSRDTGVLYGI